MSRVTSALRSPVLWLFLGLTLTAAVYAPGLGGGWLFDDYPNIVDNAGVKPASASLASLVSAAMASPASDFKRPLASLSFGLNFLASGLDAPAMKATNLAIHLLNGVATFLLVRLLLLAMGVTDAKTAGRQAALMATAWMILPINLTGVLYVVQRMESMANLAVLLGLWGYVAGRLRMRESSGGFALATASLILGTLAGVTAKETAVMLPLYAFLVEAVVFRFRSSADVNVSVDRRISWLFGVVLAAPMLAGTIWVLPRVIDPRVWASRDFTLQSRLLSESRIVLDYVAWTVVPTPSAQSFYHDDFLVSRGLLTPPSTLLSILALIVLATVAFSARNVSKPFTLGIGLFFACHLLTATILPLELIYEHRNYFASLGLVMALAGAVEFLASRTPSLRRPMFLAVAALILLWSGSTAVTALAWGDPLSLARELARRAPSSPRAQYELGRMYIIASNYDASSPLLDKAYAPLEVAAALPRSSILPEQALIFLNSRMGRPVKDAWWDSMIQKLSMSTPSVQDESALSALASCLSEQRCAFPAQRLLDAYLAALDHPKPTARLLSMYSDFAWNTLVDHPLALKMQKEAITRAPQEPTYRVNMARMCIVDGYFDLADQQIRWLESADIGGWLASDVARLKKQLREAHETRQGSPSPRNLAE